MRHRVALASALIIALLTNLVAVAPAPAQQATTQLVRLISSSGTTTITGSAQGSDAVQFPEFPGSMDSGDLAGGGTGSTNPISSVNRSFSKGHGKGSPATSATKAKSNPELTASYDGLDFRDQRLANGGNQFSMEPPDQGLCAGNGFVVESVNTVLRVFDSTGNPLTGAEDLNTFYGYAAQFDRATFQQGPFVTDPSCLYDSDTQRFYQVVLTLDLDPNTGDFLGPNHLDIAVTQTSDPTGSWTIYRVPVQDDGTQGTPNHNCSYGPCIGDYPHIGADQYGFYVTTNEYSLFGPEYKAAQLYAFSKRALASGASSVNMAQIDTAGMVAGSPGFTVWPATTPGSGNFALAAGGTEYFLSSMAAAEVNATGIDNRLAIWALTNTQSLDSSSPAVSLANSIVTVNPYALPPLSDQKAGDFPFGQCINDTTIKTPYGRGCWRYFFAAKDQPAHDEVESSLDSSDTRMLTTTYANGKLWGALDTAVTVNGVTRAGIAWYIINPQGGAGGTPSGSIVRQGYFALANNNLTYPAIGVTPSGRGVMAFTVAGQDYYPSAGYAGIDALAGVGDMHIAALGKGPDDGFTGYKASFGDPPRPRWGDYGGAVVDGNAVWLASEYIGQTCTLSQYVSTNFSCGATRTSLGNWYTRISRVTP